MRETRLEILVDATIEKNGGVKRRMHEKPRGHLGASIIGKECWRQVWYDWRWATHVKPKGRMLRLWERGHREEPAFIEWLETVGANVRYIDWDRSVRLYYHSESDSYFLVKPGEPEPGGGADWPDDVSQIDWHVMRAAHEGVIMPEPKQFGFSALWGHFSGSMDGLATGVPYSKLIVPDLRDDEEILVEFKTHGEKSFVRLLEAKGGVREAKPEHYYQMVTYMEQKGLRLALYSAVNKNDDALYYEWVLPDVAGANEMMLKAQALLTAKIIPARISNNASYWKCRFCDHRLTCHMGDKLQLNCRTCKHSQPVDNAEWRCHKWNAIIPFDAQLKGCQAHNPITD